MTILRQGDVLILKVSGLPKEAKPIHPENGRVILAHGEVTGHVHAIASPKKAIKFEAASKTFLQIIEEVGLHHEEHSEITLPPGIYQVIIQSEYTPGEFRNVQD